MPARTAGPATRRRRTLTIRRTPRRWPHLAAGIHHIIIKLPSSSSSSRLHAYTYEHTPTRMAARACTIDDTMLDRLAIAAYCYSMHAWKRRRNQFHSLSSRAMPPADAWRSARSLTLPAPLVSSIGPLAGGGSRRSCDLHRSSHVASMH